jgi:DNA-binding response OmpR family regulator
MPRPQSLTRTLTVLLVDDDENTCEAYALWCRAAGLGARTAPTAEAALAAVRADPPDVIVLDYAMPGMNGIDLLNLLRESPDLCTIPVIMMSGTDRGLRSVHGAPWLRKPVDPAALVDHIRRIRRGPPSEP